MSRQGGKKSKAGWIVRGCCLCVILGTLVVTLATLFGDGYKQVNSPVADDPKEAQHDQTPLIDITTEKVQSESTVSDILFPSSEKIASFGGYLAGEEIELGEADFLKRAFVLSAGDKYAPCVFVAELVEGDSEEEQMGSVNVEQRNRAAGATKELLNAAKKTVSEKFQELSTDDYLSVCSVARADRFLLLYRSSDLYDSTRICEEFENATNENPALTFDALVTQLTEIDLSSRNKPDQKEVSNIAD